MHMVSKRDLNSAELETMRMSKYPTTVMTANGEVQTREEATENVKELDSFVTVMLLEETPAVLSLGKTLSGSRVYLPLDKWQKNQLQYVELRTIRGPRSIDEFFHFIFTGQHGISSNRKK